MRRHRRIVVRAIAAVIALSGACAHAQHYPARPIRLIVPFPPGGPTDIAARIIGQKLNERWGQQVVVDNRAGAGGNIGAEIAAKSTPDGYTLVMGSTANIAVNPSLYRKLPYDPIKDFAPITCALMGPNLLVVNPAFPGSGVSDVIALAKAKAVTYATGGIGTPSHLAGELFKTMAHVDLVHVPYKGSIPALTDIVAGHVTLMFDSMASSLGFVKSGKLKALAQTGAKRSAAVPDLPTVSESGLKGYEVVGWFGLFAPTGTPSAIVEQLNGEVVRILALPDVKERYAAIGGEGCGSTAQQFGAFVKAETAKWAKVVRDSGAHVD